MDSRVSRVELPQSRAGHETCPGDGEWRQLTEDGEGGEEEEEQEEEREEK